jgi:hypothetical protein
MATETLTKTAGTVVSDWVEVLPPSGELNAADCCATLDGVYVQFIGWHYVNFTNFGFTFSAGMHLSSIVVKITGYLANGADSAVAGIVLDGSTVVESINSAVSMPTPVAERTWTNASVAGSYDTADVNASTFGFNLQHYSVGNLFIDYATVTATMTDDAPPAVTVLIDTSGMKRIPALGAI